MEIQAIPETTKPVQPIFTACKFNKDDVTELLGRVIVPNTEPEKRKIQTVEAGSAHMKFTDKQQSKDKCDTKQTLSLSSSVTKVREYRVPGVSNALHISVEKPDRLWVTNWANIVQTDLKGNLLQMIQTSRTLLGYNTVTQDGDLIYTEDMKNVIYRITPDKKITEFIKTEEDWLPQCVHSSRINGDILVWVVKCGECKFTRYSKAGKEIQNIHSDSKAKELYGDPRYITENINGDICISDFSRRAVVVLNKSGQHRFSYKGQGSAFSPWGICADVLGHILVCNCKGENIHLLDQDGEFLSIIISPKQGIESPRGLSVDDENNLYVGQHTNIVTVYKYLQ